MAWNRLIMPPDGERKQGIDAEQTQAWNCARPDTGAAWTTPAGVAELRSRLSTTAAEGPPKQTAQAVLFGVHHPPQTRPQRGGVLGRVRVLLPRSVGRF